MNQPINTIISANRQLEAALTDLTNRVEALERGGGDSNYNQTQTGTAEEVTQ